MPATADASARSRRCPGHRDDGRGDVEIILPVPFRRPAARCSPQPSTTRPRSTSASCRERELVAVIARCIDSSSRDSTDTGRDTASRCSFKSMQRVLSVTARELRTDIEQTIEVSRLRPHRRQVERMLLERSIREGRFRRAPLIDARNEAETVILATESLRSLFAELAGPSWPRRTRPDPVGAGRAQGRAERPMRDIQRTPR